MTKSIILKSAFIAVVAIVLSSCMGEVKYEINKGDVNIILFANGDADQNSSSGYSTGTWKWVAQPDSIIEVHLVPMSSTLEILTEEQTVILKPNADKSDFEILSGK